MPDQLFQFSDAAGSARGLVGRIILPNNKVCFSTDINAIGYAVWNLTDGGAPVTGALTVADVMYAAEQPWSKQAPPKGFTFLWPVPGALWNLPKKKYRVLITFTIKNPHPLYLTLSGLSFILTWQNDTTDPASL